jgi:energy-coupling factor transporter ATP-binding protein EcfA2
MPAFPVFNRLSVTDYGLFPGTSARAGLDVRFRPGLTLVLGANGLGKTTLVTMLYRLCTGPYDVPGLGGGGELGTRRLDAVRLRSAERRIFADRVGDAAADAQASLEFELGPTTVRVTRSLTTLALVELTVDGDSLETGSEDAFQRAVMKAAGLRTFGDWILLLRHITFYFEDRRALVWDPSAQRQVFRILLLSPAASAEWRQRERDVLERDTRMRNLRAVLSREEGALRLVEDSVAAGADILASLKGLQDAQERDQNRVVSLSDAIVELEAQRQSARAEFLTVQSDHESAFRNVERLQLRAIASAFPSQGETARYILGKLLADDVCLACGKVNKSAAKGLRDRLVTHQCVVCGTGLTRDRAPQMTPRLIANAETALVKSAEKLSEVDAMRREVESEFQALVTDLEELRTAVADRAAQIDNLIRRLPPDEAAIHEQREELVSLRARLQVQQVRLVEARSEFEDFIRRINRRIVRARSEIEDVFQYFASGFLLEDCALVWSPEKTALGQEGGKVQYPAFKLDMGGADQIRPTRRDGPGQVSESQREFIDLAFRMTLMRVAGEGGVGTLVIDAPESSLDAVFSRRAADVLTRFADSSSENRLVVTSNLTEGDLIPRLARKAKIRSGASSRVVDLLRVAAPTAATKALRPDYERVRARVFRRAAGGRK